MHLLVKSHVTWSCFWYMKYMKNGYRMRDTSTRVRSTLNMPWEKNLLAWESWCRCHWEKRDNNLKLKQCGRSQLWLRGGKSPGDISGGSESFKFPILFLGNLETSVREPIMESGHKFTEYLFHEVLFGCKCRISTVFIYLTFARLSSQEEKCSCKFHTFSNNRKSNLKNDKITTPKFYTRVLGVIRSVILKNSSHLGPAAIGQSHTAGRSLLGQFLSHNIKVETLL